MMTRKELLKIIKTTTATKPCCDCHPHGEWDECDDDCKGDGCIYELTIRNNIQLMMELMVYITLDEHKKKREDKMKREYDFSKSKKNPHAKKKQEK